MLCSFKNLTFHIFIIFQILSEKTFNAFAREKRSDIDLQVCLENFNIKLDEIIRTQDSQQMGAKYLNEVDLGSREECLRLCCETEECDVFVFEEKVSVFFCIMNLHNEDNRKGTFICLHVDKNKWSILLKYISHVILHCDRGRCSIEYATTKTELFY